MNLLEAKNLIQIPPSWFGRAARLWSSNWDKAISMHEAARDKALREAASNRLKIQWLKTQKQNEGKRI